MLNLRQYQTDLIEQTRAAMRRGVRRVAIQASTGSGKTVLAAQMLAQAASRGRRSWFICHRREILDQAVRTFVEAADIHVGIVASGYPSDASAPVQVCSVGTLARRMPKLAPPDLLVLDEAHHCPARTWKAITDAHPSAFHLGLTATPSRADARGLRPFFDELICGPSTADLIAAGFLAPYRLFAPTTVDMSKVRRRAGDYDKSETADVMARTAVVGDSVSTYCKHATGRTALVFAWSIESSQAIALAFRAAGVSAAHLDGETPDDERRTMLQSLRSGALRVISSVDVFTEGVDAGAIDALFLLRPTQSLGLYLQMVGRGLRPAPGKVCLIFDHVSNHQRFGLPDDPRQWTLDGIAKPARETAASLKRCPSCFLVASAGAKQCPSCQTPYPVKARKVVKVAGELHEADLTALRAQLPELQRQCRTLADWQALAKRMNYKAGWAFLAWQRSQQHRRRYA